VSIPKIGFNIVLSLTVKKVDAFKFDGVAKSENADPQASKFVGEYTAGYFDRHLFQ